MRNLYIMKKNIPDEELVQLFVESQEVDSFNELYRRYRPKVLRYCHAFVGDSLEAEDITQDIFIRLLTRLDSFSGRAQFSTWLYALTRNFCTDRMRLTHKQDKKVAEYCAELLSMPVDIVYDTPSDDEQIYFLQLALRKLPDWEQQLLIRKYQHGVSTQMIAKTEKCNLSAAKMRLLRARKHLRQAYTQAWANVETDY